MAKKPHEARQTPSADMPAILIEHQATVANALVDECGELKRICARENPSLEDFRETFIRIGNYLSMNRYRQAMKWIQASHEQPIDCSGVIQSSAVETAYDYARNLWLMVCVAHGGNLKDRARESMDTTLDSSEVISNDDETTLRKIVQFVNQHATPLETDRLKALIKQESARACAGLRLPNGMLTPEQAGDETPDEQSNLPKQNELISPVPSMGDRNGERRARRSGLQHPESRAYGVAIRLHKEGRLTWGNLRKEARVNTHHLKIKHPDTYKAIETLMEPGKSPKRGMRDSRTGNIDSISEE